MKYEYLKGSEKDFEGATEWATEKRVMEEDNIFWVEEREVSSRVQPVGSNIVQVISYLPDDGIDMLLAKRRPITEPVVRKCTDLRRGEIDSNDLQDHAKKFLEYDKDSGVLTWIYNTHKRFIGKEAGCIKKSGYRTLHIFKTIIEAHRLIWLIEYGYLPDCEIDHINGNKADNRISNLRLADQQKNQQNRGVRVDSQLGVKGVRIKPSGKYEARVKLTDGSRASKTFNTVNEAVIWLAKLRIESHGEYAKTPEIPTVGELMHVTEKATREDCEAIVKLLSGK